MSALRIMLRPWAHFGAVIDEAAILAYLHDLGENSMKAFKKGMNGRHSGRKYIVSGGRNHRASAKGEYPAVDTGALQASMTTDVRSRSMKIGTGMKYGEYLSDGTPKMDKRKMSKEALKEGLAATHFTRPYARFQKGSK